MRYGQAKIQIEKSGDESMQNAFYNGWLHDHFVGCVFVFVPSGIVVACAVNAPGSWRDGEIAINCKLCEKLQSVYDAVVALLICSCCLLSFLLISYSSSSRLACSFSISNGTSTLTRTCGLSSFNCCYNCGYRKNCNCDWFSISHLLLFLLVQEATFATAKEFRDICFRYSRLNFN